MGTGTGSGSHLLIESTASGGSSAARVRRGTSTRLVRSIIVCCVLFAVCSVQRAVCNSLVHAAVRNALYLSSAQYRHLQQISATLVVALSGVPSPPLLMTRSGASVAPIRVWASITHRSHCPDAWRTRAGGSYCGPYPHRCPQVPCVEVARGCASICTCLCAYAFACSFVSLADHSAGLPSSTRCLCLPPAVQVSMCMSVCTSLVHMSLCMCVCVAGCPQCWLQRPQPPCVPSPPHPGLCWGRPGHQRLPSAHHRARHAQQQHQPELPCSPPHPSASYRWRAVPTP
jgi:hypothetical protein